MVFKRSYVIRAEYCKLHLFAYLKLKDYDRVQLFVLSTFPIFYVYLESINWNSQNISLSKGQVRNMIDDLGLNFSLNIYDQFFAKIIGGNLIYSA